MADTENVNFILHKLESSAEFLKLRNGVADISPPNSPIYAEYIMN